MTNYKLELSLEESKDLFNNLAQVLEPGASNLPSWKHGPLIKLYHDLYSFLINLNKEAFQSKEK